MVARCFISLCDTSSLHTRHYQLFYVPFSNFISLYLGSIIQLTVTLKKGDFFIHISHFLNVCVCVGVCVCVCVGVYV